MVEMHLIVGFNTLAIVPLLLSALKMQVNARGDVNSFHHGMHVLGRWKRASNAATCSAEQNLVNDRIRSMNNVTRKLFADETEFTGDNKFSLQMSWTGRDTERIIVVTSEVGLSSSVYLSDERSKHFENISSRIGDAAMKHHLSLQKHPLISETVYIVANPLFGRYSSLYISNDAGNTFNGVQFDFLVTGNLVFHPNDTELILVEDRLRRELWLSKDRGTTWSKIKSNIISFRWTTAPNSFDIFVITGDNFIFSNSKSNVLEKTTDFGHTWTTIYKSVIAFGIGGKFLYASAYVSPDSDERRLVVSTDAGMNWTHAVLPTVTPDRFFSILDASEGQIFLHVDEPGDTGKGTLYLSDATGILFTKSLENHLYPNFHHLTDFYPVKSMRGVYIANQLASDNSIHTVISYNRGGDWQSVERPQNVPCEDETHTCSLHIHNEYSRLRNVQANPPLSIPNAAGLVLVHGHVAAALQTSDPDVFVSSDGGYSWRLALKGPHHYVIGDHGGLLVAVPADTPTPSVVKFSTDEGHCWINYNFTEGGEQIQFTGLLIEPGNKAMMVAIWGYTDEHIWHTYFINFTALINRRCGDSDYEEWVAHSHHAGGCLLGANETFKRLKPDSWCYNGRAYVVSKTERSCPCTVDDFDCDFGYMRQGNVDKCVEDPSLKDKQIHICRRNHEDNIVAVGYHKIPGDRCKGGFFPSDAPRIDLLEVCQGGTDSLDELSAKAKQPNEKPKAGTVIIAIILICCIIVVAVAITIYARKHQKSYGSYHYMSIRSDDVRPDDNKPLNTSVYDNSSDDEPVLS